ncbi:MAG: RHS repeat-associated core domain-containing protein [Myxococcota bacterium]
MGGNELLSTSYSTNAAACNDPDATITQTRTRDVLGRQTNYFQGRFGESTADFDFDYGRDGRLSRATDSGGSYYIYLYDHRMLRSRSTVGAPFVGDLGVRDTIYGISGNLLTERVWFDIVHNDYVWLGSTPVAMLVDTDASGPNPATPVILGVDHLGTPHRSWDRGAGVTTWAGDYDAFGACTSWLPGGGTPSAQYLVNLRFPGQFEDGETGMHYNHWRYYDVSTGRYVTADPLGRDGRDDTLFRYASSRPYSAIDPSGLRWRDAYKAKAKQAVKGAFEYIYRRIDQGTIDEFEWGGWVVRSNCQPNRIRVLPVRRGNRGSIELNPRKRPKQTTIIAAYHLLPNTFLNGGGRQENIDDVEATNARGWAYFYGTRDTRRVWLYYPPFNGRANKELVADF